MLSALYRFLKKDSLPLLITALFFIVWEYLSRNGIISDLLFPAPSKIFVYLLNSIKSGEFFRAVSATLTRLLCGFVLGAIPGLFLGWAMGFSTRVRDFFSPFIAALHPIPKIAIFPFILFLFGIGEISRLIAVAITTFFPVLLNTLAGMQQLNPVYLQVAQNYGASRWKTFVTIAFPGSLPWILTGARIALNTSFMVLIAIELLASKSGLGVLIWFGWETLNTSKLYIALIAIALIGMLINILFNFLLVRYLPWHHSSIEEHEN